MTGELLNAAEVALRRQETGVSPGQGLVGVRRQRGPRTNVLEVGVHEAEGDAGDMSDTEAREHIRALRVNLGRAAAIAERLYAGRAWIALGYEHWEALCGAEIRPHMPRMERPQLVTTITTLSSTGMSTRAIAAAVGASQSTVARAVATTEPKNSVGLDGRTRKPAVHWQARQRARVMYAANPENAEMDARIEARAKRATEKEARKAAALIEVEDDWVHPDPLIAAAMRAAARLVCPENNTEEDWGPEFEAAHPEFEADSEARAFLGGLRASERDRRRHRYMYEWFAANPKPEPTT